ncbi:glycine D-amino acid oxidase [Raphidocelis subcapitata]|uniref:Glycine D-amino acid oxidase n=1 Tax=Raphidocelis subcapitata TaxID=307507 RepID=A0A2V0NPV1_9CHLO|nr:glycine D-amino acid oxidase [Raphidocelis subcapitata]|eukprot:GBF87530.1 glycine D-amino acid oxidase [Raphidocelis subcapitata]
MAVGAARSLRVALLAVRAPEPRRYYVQITVVGPSGPPLPPSRADAAAAAGAAGGARPAGGADGDAALRPDSVARTETAPMCRTPEFENRAFVMRLPQPLGGSLHARAVVQVSLFALPSAAAPPGPVIAGRESDDLMGRGYVELRGEVAARLLRGERVALPVALADLGPDLARAVAATGASKLRALRGAISGETERLLALRGGSGGGVGGMYGRSDLEALVELSLLDAPAAAPAPGGAADLTGAAPLGAGGGGRGGALSRAPSARVPSECSLLVLVSAAEGLPLVKGRDGHTGPPAACVFGRSQRDADQRLAAQGVTRVAAPGCAPAWGELLRVTYAEEALPGEKLLLTVADDPSGGQPLLQAAVPLAAVVPGIHYNLKLMFPGAGGPALYVSLLLRPGARTQLRHLRLAAAAADPRARLLQARLAATSAPLGGAGGDAGGRELWTVWRPRGGAGAPAAADSEGGFALHAPVDATDAAAIDAALRGVAAAVLGAPARAGGEGRNSAPASPAAEAGPPPHGALLQAFPVQRLPAASDGGDAASNGGGLIWPLDHMTLLPLGSRSGSRGGGRPGGGGIAGDRSSSGGGGPDVVLELFEVRYPAADARVFADGAAGAAPPPLVLDGAGGGDAPASPALTSAGRAVQALQKARAAQHKPQEAAQGGQAAGEAHQKQPAPRPQPRRGPFARLVARLELPPERLPAGPAGERVVLDGLPLAAPDGADAGTATIEAVPWDAASLLAHLQAFASSGGGGGGGGGGSGSGGARATGDAAALATCACSCCGAGLAGGALLLLRTLARDMVAKQSALERLQRQLDAADMRCEAAAGRLRELRGRNSALADEAEGLRRVIQEGQGAGLGPPGAAADGAGGCSCCAGDGEPPAESQWASPLGLEPSALPPAELLPRALAADAALRRERRRNAELVHRLQQLHGEQIDVISLQRRHAELQEAHVAQAAQLAEHEALADEAGLLRDAVKKQEAVIARLERLLAAAAAKAKDVDAARASAAAAESEAARARDALEQVLSAHPAEVVDALRAQSEAAEARAAAAEAAAEAARREAGDARREADDARQEAEAAGRTAEDARQTADEAVAAAGREAERAAAEADAAAAALAAQRQAEADAAAARDEAQRARLGADAASADARRDAEQAVREAQAAAAAAVEAAEQARRDADAAVAAAAARAEEAEQGRLTAEAAAERALKDAEAADQARREAEAAKAAAAAAAELAEQARRDAEAGALAEIAKAREAADQACRTAEGAAAAEVATANALAAQARHEADATAADARREVSEALARLAAEAGARAAAEEARLAAAREADEAAAAMARQLDAAREQHVAELEAQRAQHEDELSELARTQQAAAAEAAAQLRSQLAAALAAAEAEREAARAALEAERQAARAALESALDEARAEAAAAAAAAAAAGAAGGEAAAAEKERQRLEAELRAERAEASAVAAQNELVDVTKRYAREIAELKARLAEAEAHLAGGFGPVSSLYGAGAAGAGSLLPHFGLDASLASPKAPGVYTNQGAWGIGANVPAVGGFAGALPVLGGAAGPVPPAAGEGGSRVPLQQQRSRAAASGGGLPDPQWGAAGGPIAGGGGAAAAAAAASPGGGRGGRPRPPPPLVTPSGPASAAIPPRGDEEGGAAAGDEDDALSPLPPAAAPGDGGGQRRPLTGAGAAATPTAAAAGAPGGAAVGSGSGRWRGAAAGAGGGADGGAAAVPPAAAAGGGAPRFFDAVDASQPQAGGAGGRTTYDALLAADAAWRAVRSARPGDEAAPRPRFLTESRTPLGDGAAAAAFDVVVCGGTLGIFVAAALAARGHRVAVIERAELRGRAQEWNISRKELAELREMGLLTAEEEAAAVAIEFNPVRVGFSGAGDVWTRDVLNLGVRPDALIQAMRARLEAAGGAVLDQTQLLGVEVRPDGAALRVAGPGGGGDGGGGDGGGGGGERTLAARLVIDCMGNQSPIVRQARWGIKPDGVCLVVGGCASGFDPERNKTADVICTVTDAAPLAGGRAGGVPLQLFWEAFPSSDSPDSRTTYMFTYSDAQPFRPGLLDLFEEYWERLPEYQGVASAEDLRFRRLLFAFFPTYRDSPLPPSTDRVLQIGDASGIQSPLSFGGFGALMRHARRLVGAIDDALACDALTKDELAAINPYSPALSAAWMLQRAMTAARGPGEAAPANLINRMLGGNFAAMEGLGDAVMRPFLQDVLQFGPLARTMSAQMVRDPAFVPQLVAHIGVGPLVDWVGHVAALGAYGALHAAAAPALRARLLPQLSPREGYRLRRTLEAWEYGSGADYKL